MKFCIVILLSGIAGAIVACAVATLALLLRTESLALLKFFVPIFAVWGAYVGMTIAIVSPRSPLTGWMRASIIGITFGVFATGSVTAVVAAWLGGPTFKGITVFLPTGLWHGLSVGVIVGPVAGFLASRQQLEKTAS